RTSLNPLLPTSSISTHTSPFLLPSFSFYLSPHHRDLHSFPTRRSSDLTSSNIIKLSLVALLIILDTSFISTMKVLSPCDKLSDADRKSTRLNSSHVSISYAVFCLKKKKKKNIHYKLNDIR